MLLFINIMCSRVSKQIIAFGIDIKQLLLEWLSIRTE